MIRETKSVCPECKKLIPARLIEENGRIFMEKECKEHGYYKEYCYHKDFYEKVMDYFKYVEGNGEEIKGCPHKCNTCKKHKTETALAVIDLTSRCNLNCEYCFANANKRIYEPSTKQIKETISFLRKKQPRCNAILFSGGEPTLREDLFEILDHVKKERFDCPMIATNGIRIAKDPKFTKELVNHGVGVIYLSFDGLSEKTNRYKKSHLYIKNIIKNCRKSGMQIMLVPAVAKGINDNEVYGLIKFAIKNSEVIRGINFQPIGFSGRADYDPDKRYTIPDLCKDIEKQSNGKIKADSFYPVNACTPLTNFFEALTNEKMIKFSMHPMCGMATYIHVENGKVIPITEFLDVGKFIELCDRYTNEFNGKDGFERTIVNAKFIAELQGTVKKKVEVLPFLANLILRRDYKALEEFHKKTLFIGAMHFQDCFNLDLQRLQRCGVHYVTPDKHIIPFCAYNNLGYREKIENKFSKCGYSNLGFRKTI